MKLLFEIILTIILFSCNEDEITNYDSCITRTCTIKVSNECTDALNDLSYLLNDSYTFQTPESYEKVAFYFRITEKQKMIFFKDRIGTQNGNILHLFIVKLDQLLENNIMLDTITEANHIYYDINIYDKFDRNEFKQFYSTNTLKTQADELTPADSDFIHGYHIWIFAVTIQIEQPTL